MQPYGIELIESFLKFWPDECFLYVYLDKGADKVDFKNVTSRTKVFDYNKEIQDHKYFCNKFKNYEQRQDDYRLNAFKFAFKIFAMKKALSICSAEYLIWLDADIITIKPIRESFLNSLVDKNKYTSYLGRSHVKKENVRYSETGFIIFNTQHTLHSTFWKQIDEMYLGGKLFKLDSWTDSHVFDAVRTNLEKNERLQNINISDFGIRDVGNESHVFVASILGDYMDHKKGSRKKKKWSPEFIYRYKTNNNN